MATKPITLRLSEKLLARIEAEVLSSGTNRNQVVSKALEQIFMSPSDKAPPAPDKAPPTLDSSVVKQLKALKTNQNQTVFKQSLNFGESLKNQRPDTIIS